MITLGEARQNLLREARAARFDFGSVAELREFAATREWFARQNPQIMSALGEYLEAERLERHNMQRRLQQINEYHVEQHRKARASEIAYLRERRAEAGIVDKPAGKPTPRMMSMYTDAHWRGYGR